MIRILRFAISTFYILIFVITCYVSTAHAQDKGYRLKTIVIDAGHGGNKPGASGAYSLEKNIATAKQQELEQRIMQNQINAFGIAEDGFGKMGHTHLIAY